MTDATVAVVVPCYKVKSHIERVLYAMPDFVSAVYVVDDACPDRTGRHVEEAIRDPRVKVLFHETNQGVGGAVLTGYAAALTDGADIVVKVDGDDQMDLSQLGKIIRPILEGKADYTKGNRFSSVESIEPMPRIRIFGNAILSIFNKVSSGYWNITDPTNGYTAIHRGVLAKLSFVKISRRYFFESDLLFRLSLLRAVVVDVPMDAIYGDEKSGINISRILGPFISGHIRNFLKRIVYQYYLREWNVASFELPLALALLTFGIVASIYTWLDGLQTHSAAAPGTVMIDALPLIFGLQLMLSFINYDVESTPKIPRQDLD